MNSPQNPSKWFYMSKAVYFVYLKCLFPHSRQTRLREIPLLDFCGTRILTVSSIIEKAPPSCSHIWRPHKPDQEWHPSFPTRNPSNGVHLCLWGVLVSWNHHHHQSSHAGAGNWGRTLRILMWSFRETAQKGKMDCGDTWLWPWGVASSSNIILNSTHSILVNMPCWACKRQYSL